MPKKKDDNFVDNKKKREEITQELIDEIKEPIKEQIVDEAVHDVKSVFNNEFKEDLKSDIKKEIVNDIKRDIAKDQKRLVHGKNFKIFRLSLYLIIVVGCLLYLLYRLYTTDNMGVIDKRLTRPTTKGLETTLTTKEAITEPVKDLNYYLEKYSSVLADIKISNYDLVKGEYTIDAISVADKLALAYANLAIEDIFVDGVIHTVMEEKLMGVYQRMFGSVEGYTPTSFVIHGLTYAYSATTASYIAIGEDDGSGYINNYVTDIKELDNTLEFTSRVYIVKDDGIYNVNNPSYRVAGVNDDISKIQNRLSTVVYKFVQTESGYLLTSINKK